MKTVQHILPALALLLVSALAAQASPLELPQKETLRYVVSYKWGLVQKDAGRVTIRLRSNGDKATATLTGKTDPWADAVYSVRDTLVSRFSRSTMLPVEYRRVAHEDGSYARDIVKFSRSGQDVTASTTVERRGKKADSQLTTKHHTLSAQGATVDMLSALYYLRALDFQSLQKGQSRAVNIFSGKRKELLKITYLGPEKLKLGGSARDTYHVRFTFTSDGGKESSAPIDAWIGTSPSRIPLKIEGSLKIGKVRCIYAGS